MAWNTPERVSVFMTAGSVTVVAIVGVIVTMSVMRTGGLSDDVRAVTARIDQLYPTLTTQAADIATIRASLDTSAQRIADVAASLEIVSERLDATVALQESQTQNIGTMTTAVRELTDAVAANQSQLDAIADDVRNLRESSLRSPNKFVLDGYALVPKNASVELLGQLEMAGVKPIQLDAWLTWGDLADTTTKYSELFGGNAWLGVSDASLVEKIITETE